MENRNTVHCELVAKQEGQYVQYIFKNLEESENSVNRYIMATRCPNWQGTFDMPVGISGFLTFEDVVAGDKYYNPDTGITSTYRYTGRYFINFIKDQIKDNNVKEFKF